MLKIVAGASLVACCIPASTLAAEATGHRTTPAPADFRLHASVSATANRPPILDAPDGRLRTGFGNSLVELYPFRKSGFHLAAGGRLYGRGARSRSIDNEQARLLAGPRGTGMRGTRRASPAALIGMARGIGQGLALGIDGGALLGRLDSAPNRLGRLQPARGGQAEGHLNQIARVTVQYRF